MKRILPALVLATALMAGTSFAAAVDPLPPGDASLMMVVDSATFLKVVPDANEFEIQSSKIALEKSTSDDVKMAAQMIIDDHTKAGEKLKATLEAEGKTAPEPTLSPKHEKQLAELNAAPDDTFDMLYLDIQAQAHMEAIALFRTYAGSGDDQTLVGFAKETLPTLETHMAHVKKLIAAD